MADAPAPPPDVPAPSYWPEAVPVAAPVDAPPAATLMRIAVPASFDPERQQWLPALVAAERLHPDEAVLAEAMPPARRDTFVAGRLAMRAAIGQHAPVDRWAPILRSARGAPVLPPAMTGSISHKRDAALAIVAPRQVAGGATQHVGIDLEHRPTARDLEKLSIARRVLTTDELDALRALDADPLAQRERVLVSFAIKEAIYKAIDPTVERYVHFTEVALHFREAGVVNVELRLPELRTDEWQVSARYALDDRWIMAVATAVRAVP